MLSPSFERPLGTPRFLNLIGLTSQIKISEMATSTSQICILSQKGLMLRFEFDIKLEIA